MFGSVVFVVCWCRVVGVKCSSCRLFYFLVWSGLFVGVGGCTWVRVGLMLFLSCCFVVLVVLRVNYYMF